jgi:hypothetical protein
MARYKFSRISTHANRYRAHISTAPLVTIAIRHNQVMPYLVMACPSFREPLKSFLRKTNTRLIYITLGEFAKHLLALYKHGNTSEFSAVADTIEYLYIHGTNYVKNAITGGFLEVIQNVWRYNNVNPEEFTKYLHPVSARYWHSMVQCMDE